MSKCLLPYLLLVLCSTVWSLVVNLVPRADRDSQTDTEHFVMGQQVSGAMPIYMSEHNLVADKLPKTFFAQVQYPLAMDAATATANNASAQNILTKVEIYMEGDVGLQSQVYVVSGGIGRSTIELKIVADQTEWLHYYVLLYGIVA